MNLLEFAQMSPEKTFKAEDFVDTKDCGTYLVVTDKLGNKYGLSKSELTEDLADKSFRVFQNSRGENWLTSKAAQEVKSRF